MSEPTPPLADVLEELRAVLDTSDELDPADRDALRSAAAEIHEALEGGASADAAPQSDLRARLTQAVERFEGRHPKLTHVVNRVAESLSDIGI